MENGYITPLHIVEIWWSIKKSAHNDHAITQEGCTKANMPILRIGFRNVTVAQGSVTVMCTFIDTKQYFNNMQNVSMIGYYDYDLHL